MDVFNQHEAIDGVGIEGWIQENGGEGYVLAGGRLDGITKFPDMEAVAVTQGVSCGDVEMQV